MAAPLDPDNPVVKHCAAGMQAEFAGRPAEARHLFLLAWEERRNDFEASIAAHYVARVQEDPKAMLRWNELALQHAQAHAAAAGEQSVADFFPSLLLNMGWSYENLGDLPQARFYYGLAAERVGLLAPGPYRATVEQGIANGLARAGQADADDAPGAA